MRLKKIRKFIHDLDQFLSNTLIKERVYEIDLNNCIDEFGNCFGNNNHFLSQALNINNHEDRINYLENHYAKNKIKNINQMLNYKLDNIYGNFYFCPWEAGRLRKLDVFLVSHKIGPTTNKIIKKILFRLLNIKESIIKNGYRTKLIHNNYIRVIKVIDRDKKIKYMVRDGQHRCAVLSFFGYEKILVINEHSYWEKSKLLRLIINLFKTILNKNAGKQLKNLEEINFSKSNDWPYVKAGILTKSEAEKIFDLKFKHLFN